MRPAQELDYLRLAKEARTLDTSGCKTVVRLALLADFATQQLVPLLRVLFARRGVRLEVYEADYDSIDVEIHHPASGLYAFEPQIVAILVAGEKLKARFYQAADRARFADDTVARFAGLWDTLRRHTKATIVQGNYVLPLERAFGNFEAQVADSLGATFATVNQRLAERAREASSVLLCDVDFLAASVGRRAWIDERLWHLAKSPCRLDHLPLLADAVADVALAAVGQFAKCVVLDLDNTLWGGVIGDDGLEGIALGGFDEGEAFVALQRFLRELKRRGIVLAVVSKNERDNALLPFKQHPDMVLGEADIAVFVANWDNKADNIRRVQEVLNIGFDSMVFLDDNPFERNIVREFLPRVVVPELPEDPSLYLRALAELNLFETASYSEADRKRPDQYREEAQRELTKTEFANVGDYLASLEMKVKLERFTRFNLPRIAQLMQRSNQFNLCTRRHSEAACEAFMNDPSCLPFTLSLADKFGDYGLISVVVAKTAGDALDVDEYLMSCRVLQRGVEDFAMNALFEAAEKRGLRRVTGRYLKTEKNGMVRAFYGGFGFEKVAENERGDTEWSLEVTKYRPRRTFLSPAVREI